MILFTWHFPSKWSLFLILCTRAHKFGAKLKIFIIDCYTNHVSKYFTYGLWSVTNLQGGSRDFEKGWRSLSAKMLGFRWSKKAKMTLETIGFWQNISISIFKFSPFLCTMKAFQWNLVNFSKLANDLIRKEKKTLMQQSMRKETLRKIRLCFKTGCFISPLIWWLIIFCFAHSQSNFCFLISGWRKKYKKGK